MLLLACHFGIVLKAQKIEANLGGCVKSITTAADDPTIIYVGHKLRVSVHVFDDSVQLVPIHFQMLFLQRVSNFCGAFFSPDFPY